RTQCDIGDRRIAQVPPGTIDARLVCGSQGADLLAVGPFDCDLNLLRRLLQVVVDGRAIGRILTDRWTFRRHVAMESRAEAVCGTRWKEIYGGVTDAVIELLERREVVEDPEAASVGADNEILKMILDDDPMNRRMRQIVLQWLPTVAIVE